MVLAGQSGERGAKWSYRVGGQITFDYTTAGGNSKKSDGILREGCAMKYAWIDAHRQDYDLTEMCETLLVSHNGYRAWKGGGCPNRERLTVIKAIDAEVKGAYGMAAHGTRITSP